MRRLIVILLHLFPKNFRDRFETDMLATFDDRWSERAGPALAARTVIDLASSVVIERSKGDHAMKILCQDLRYGVRTLLKTPAFTLVAIITLALGIGVTTAMFSVAHAVLWRSLPYPRPERLVAATEAEIKRPDQPFGVSYLNFRDWQAQSTVFQSLAATLFDQRTLRDAPEPVRVTGAAVSHQFFEALGVGPAMGRIFSAAEDIRGGPDVAVLSHSMWTKRFASDPSIVGRTVHFAQSALTVIGVMPEGFDYPPQSEYWVAIEPNLNKYFIEHRNVYVLRTIGRLREGKTINDAHTQLSAIADRIYRDHPEANRGLMIRTAPLRDELGRDLKPALLALLGASALVLLITCGNLAGLMLVRGSGRAREFAIRAALGAARQRLIRQLLTESALISIVGGAAGVALAWLAMQALPLLSKDPRLHDIALDQTMLLAALAATVITALLFGTAPAIRASRADATQAIRQTRGSDPRRARAQQMVVVAEVALCLVLLMGAGLLLESFRRVLSVNPGFREDHLVTMQVSLPSSYSTVSAVTGFFHKLTERLPSLPGVSGASVVSRLPIDGGDSMGDINIEGQPLESGNPPAASFRRTLPYYFRVMGIPLVRGREFDETDDAQHPHVMIISESMAQRFWPNQDPVGQHVKIGPKNDAPWRTVVGVVKDVRHNGLDAEPGFATYEPLAQEPWTSVAVAIRAQGDPRSVMASARAELRRIEPGLLIDKVQTMDERIGDSVAPRRLNLTLFATFAALALLLSAVGLYGVVAYAAEQRTHEFGIRMALGAQTGDVLRMVLGQGLKLAAAGVAIGIIAALAMSRVIATLLYQVQPFDAMTMASVALLVAAVAVTACWLPARRATRVAPTVALRCE
jgi:putative ABC transport system permease protein